MSGLVYFNDNEPYVAEWLRNLYPKADVDVRSVTDVTAKELVGYERAHFFAGIGGWQYALDLAGWSGPVWTASLPCQPFSTAGKRKGESDERHLWPVFRELVAECRPPVIFGEQVASKDGKVWLSRVRADLEVLGYGVGAADLCAASIGAPHIRQRLYWVAYSNSGQRGRLADSAGRDDLDRTQAGWQQGDSEPQSRGVPRGMGHTRSDASEPWRFTEQSREGFGAQIAGPYVEPGRSGTPWSEFEVVACLDDRFRRIEPGSFPLAARLPSTVGRLRAYGNSICIPLAAEFVSAFMELANENEQFQKIVDTQWPSNGASPRMLPY